MHWEYQSQGWPPVPEVRPDRVRRGDPDASGKSSRRRRAQTRAVLEVKHRADRGRHQDVRLLGDAGDFRPFSRGQAEGAREAAGEGRELGRRSPSKWDELRAAAAACLRGAFAVALSLDRSTSQKYFHEKKQASTQSSAIRPLLERTHHRRQPKALPAWLQTLHEGAHGNSDLVRIFFAAHSIS